MFQHLLDRMRSKNVAPLSKIIKNLHRSFIRDFVFRQTGAKAPARERCWRPIFAEILAPGAVIGLWRKKNGPTTRVRPISLRLFGGKPGGRIDGARIKGAATADSRNKPADPSSDSRGPCRA